MSIQACAELVKRGDPDRFMATMTGDADQRASLFPLFAFNLEVARASYVTAEPMIAEMRLQWWADTIEEIYADKPPRQHEVATPLAALIRKTQLPQDLFQNLIEARRFDIYPDPPKSPDALNDYLSATGAGLMQLSVQALGEDNPERVATSFKYGRAVAASNYLVAIPELLNLQKSPLYDGSAGGVSNLAEMYAAIGAKARTAWGRARSPALPALRTGWVSGNILRRAMKHPTAVIDGQLQLSDFNKRTLLLLKSALGTF